MFEYLASEVLDQMPPPLRRFLLRCSVLAELTASRCAAVSGDAQAARWLDEIERRGLFVTVLDEMPLTLRLHDLFRDFLLDRLQREPGEDLAALLVRAAAGEPDPVRQVDLLLRAGDLAAAQRALAAATPTLLLDGASAQALRLIDRFPTALRDGSPLLAFVRGLCAWPRFEWVTMQEAMARAAAGFDRLGLAGETQQAKAFESVALTALGRLEAAAERLAQVRALPMQRDTAALVELMSYWQAGARARPDAPALHLQRTGRPARRGRAAAGRGTAASRTSCSSAAPACVPRWSGSRAWRWTAPARATRRCARAPSASRPGCCCWQGRLDAAQALIRDVQDDDRWLGQPRNLRITTLASSPPCTRCAASATPSGPPLERCWPTSTAMPSGEPPGVGCTFTSRPARGGAGRPAFAEETQQALAATPSENEWPFMRGARAAAVRRVRPACG